MVFCVTAACGGPAASPDAAQDGALAMDAAVEPEASVERDAASDGASDGSSSDGASVDAGALEPVERSTIARRTDSCVGLPTEFGAYGAITQYDRYQFANPAWVGPSPTAVQVFAPVGGAATRPVLFYSHAFGGSDWTRVRSLIEFLVSNDYAVVFAPYATVGATVCQRYDTLWGGHSMAVDRLGARVGMDTTRVGFIGHSFGGGASPWLATEAVRARGWGSNGVFLMPNAPWYSFRMDAARWATLPASARLHVMVFTDDTTNDHRIAIEDQWTPFAGAKQWISLVSDRNGACMLSADHVVPATDSDRMDSVRFDALDTWGVWRHAHAVADCALRGRGAACALIDGSNPLAQTAMGTWTSNGAPVARAQRSDAPSAPREPSAYMFPVTQRSMYPCDGRGG